MMPQNPSVRDVLDRVLWLARQLAWADSAVIFLRSAGKVKAKVYRSGYRHLLVRDSKLGIQEPIVLRALAEQTVAHLSQADATPHRIFRDEPTALAIPIEQEGVLYLGRRSGEQFDEASITHLVALCQQAYFALNVARLSTSRQALEREEEDARQNAESLLNSVSSIVELMGDVMTLHSPEAVLQSTGDNLFRLANFSFWAIVAGPVQEGRPEYFLSGTEHKVEIDEGATIELSLKAMASGRTLSFMNLERLSLPRPGPEIRSVLVCPMLADREAIGCIMLCSKRICFSRRERELLSTLALQVGSHFWNLHLHESLVEAHESLKYSQAQLVQSSKMAAVGQLAAGVAHELNTPLGAMNLAIEGAMRSLESKPERTLKRLDRALNAGNQLKEIINKLLYYSKQATSEVEETDLNQVVADAVDLVGHQLSLERVMVTTELKDIELVLVNKNEIQQIVINLLTNAKDAVKEVEPSEREVVASTKFAHGFVELSVRDNGSGMTQETKEKAFDPFYTTKEVGSGTGLGLSVTKELLEKNGGDIRLESEFGVGTTFVLRFPTSSEQ